MKIPLLFDLDGTLTDPKPGFLASVNSALEALGESPREASELVQYIGPPLRGTFAILLAMDDAARIETAVRLYRERLHDGGMFAASVYPGIRDLLGKLAGDHFRLFVATGKNREAAEKIVEHFGLAPYFEAVHGAEIDGRFADKAELVAHLWSWHSLPADHGLMIGDTRYDIRAGRLNGLETVGVTWGYGTREQMMAEQAGRFVDHPEELGVVIRDLYGPADAASGEASAANSLTQ